MTSTPSSSAETSPASTHSASEAPASGAAAAALAYYRAHSAVTEPGPGATLFAGLPPDLATLARVAGGLVAHYFGAEHVYGWTPPADRLGEVDTRWVAAMLGRIAALDPRPLIEPRPLERRLVGCCRDVAVLLCALARHQGIPARVRVGFARYFLPGAWEDHAVTECWDEAERRWRLVDGQLDEPQRAHYRIAFDPLDVPRDQFLVGGCAWLTCRSGGADPERFGVSAPGAPRGWRFLQGRLLLDLAALDKTELLQWDVWGLGLHQAAGAELELLDEVARLTQAGEDGIAAARALVAGDDRLRVPVMVRSWSPAAGPRQVALR